MAVAAGVELAAIPSFDCDLSLFLSSLFRLASELLFGMLLDVFEVVIAPIADVGAPVVGVVVALFTRLPLLPDTDCPI